MQREGAGVGIAHQYHLTEAACQSASNAAFQTLGPGQGSSRTHLHPGS